MIFKVGMSFKKSDKPNRYIHMRSRRDSHCVECEQDINEGDEFVYDAAESKAYCLECGKELSE